MTGWQRTLTGLSLLALLTGCSQMERHDPPDQSGYCLRAGQDQAFDCSAPALEINQVRDPLQPRSRFTDEELFSLLSEVKRWLERERLIAAGEPVPPHLQPKEPPAPPPEPVSPPDSPLWPRVLEALSR